MDIGKFFRNDSDLALAELISRHVGESKGAALALSRLMADVPRGVKSQLNVITGHEQAGDQITAQLRGVLDDVFILKQLPKDHVSRLVTHLDDMLDNMRDAARYIDVYMIDAATPEALKFAAVIGEMVTHLSTLTDKLLTLTSKEVQEVYSKLVALEGEADELRSVGANALARRIKGQSEVPVKVDELYALIALKDIYAKLERVTDHCLHAVNEIAIMVRNY